MLVFPDQLVNHIWERNLDSFTLSLSAGILPLSFKDLKENVVFLNIFSALCPWEKLEPGCIAEKRNVFV